MIETVDVLTGIVPVVLIVAFILLVVRMMTDGKTGMVDRMKQAVGGVVMLLVALLVIFAFIGGSSPDDPDPEPTESYDVHFYVATDSAGYGTVSASVLRDVAAGTSVTVGQTISVGGAGQCTATPSASTDQYEYAFAGWTGADDADTPAPTSIAADTAYYAHFTRTETGPTPMDPALFTFTVADGEATITGWAGTEPEAGYDLVIPETDGDGHPVTAIGGWDYGTSTSAWSKAASAHSATATIIKESAFQGCTSLVSIDFPSVISFENNAFKGCTSLTTAVFPAATSVSANFGPFADCTSLTTVYFPAATVILGGFINCTSLTTVSSQNFPSLTDLGNGALLGCTSLTTVDLPAVTHVGANALKGCTSLTTVDLPAVESVGYRAFEDCTGVTHVALGPMTGTYDIGAFYSWTFYDADGTTVLNKNVAANLANSTFEGVYNALVKVDSNRGLTPEMEQRVLELSAENSLKASMLAELDPELADMDPSDVARMTVSEIESMTADDVRAIKSSLPSRSD